MKSREWIETEIGRLITELSLYPQRRIDGNDLAAMHERLLALLVVMDVNPRLTLVEPDPFGSAERGHELRL